MPCLIDRQIKTVCDRTTIKCFLLIRDHMMYCLKEEITAAINALMRIHVEVCH